MEEIEEGEGCASDVDDGKGSVGQPFEDGMILGQGEVEQADGGLGGHEGGILHLVSRRHTPCSIRPLSRVRT